MARNVFKAFDCWMFKDLSIYSLLEIIMEVDRVEVGLAIGVSLLGRNVVLFLSREPIV